ncbi:hypothetical protein IFM89_000166 [Coptis chinensis]|uniref:PPM-type phosphatase domain-containing protein n=1 Tax=Coptis chinensis TaxID=261450 RepID=A0A835H2B7_9MAGN|nr:hypothetical protein IFM89_000166 [Coptis chinensis]
MGNGLGKLSVCFTGPRNAKHDIAMLITDPLDEGLGHSFCYVRPDDPYRASLSKVHSEETTTFRSISGASVSANTSTPLSTAFIDLHSYSSIDRAAAFESSTSFASIPLQPVPRSLLNSSFSGNLGGGMGTGGFLSGPIERGFMSGPLDRGMFSGPLEKGSGSGYDNQFQRSFSHGGFAFNKSRYKSAGSLIRVLRKAISNTVIRGQNSIVTPIKGVFSVKESDWVVGSERNGGGGGENFTISSANLSSELSLEEDDDCLHSQNLQWAQGKAGEDRVHVVISEEYGWVFVGIYDGFNGPDAPDYLLSNLYSAVHKEVKGLLWEDKYESATITTIDCELQKVSSETDKCDELRKGNETSCSDSVEHANSPLGNDELHPNWKPKRSNGKHLRNGFRGAAKKWEENHRRWKCEWDKERLELDSKLKEHLNQSNPQGVAAINHDDVLKALSQALKKTEDAYLDVADKMVKENPELALMGSCVLVMLMKGQDVYVMNVGDSRAVLAQKAEPDLWLGKAHHDLEKITEETLHELEACDGDQSERIAVCLSALQLTLDHSTSMDEEVRRIKNEHPDDDSAVINERVKGSLKVTRAFGAGFLKQYFTNEEAVSEVELFITSSPDGDPAQHLIEEVLFRAAKKAGMDFHELLEIPQGDRRRYHDDVSIIVISLEGRIWRSCV